MATITRYVNTGSTPGGDGTTNGTSGSTRAFASLNEAEASLQRTTSDTIDILCDGSTADNNNPTTIDGWSVSSPGFIIVRGNPNARHAGVWSDSVYRNTMTDDDRVNITVREQRTKIQDLQLGSIVDTQTGWGYTQVTFASNLDGDTLCYLEGCLLRCSGNTRTTSSACVCLNSNNGTYYISNNAFIGWNGSDYARTIQLDVDDIVAYIQHNTFTDFEYTAINCAGNPRYIRLRNNLFQNPVYGGAGCRAVVLDAGGSFHSASDYNVTFDNESVSSYKCPGANSKLNTTVTLTSTSDCHTSDTDAQVANNLYSDSAYPTTTDFDGGSRPSTGSVYAGCDEPSGATNETITPSAATSTISIQSPTISSDVNATYVGTTLAATVSLNSPTVSAEVNATHAGTTLASTSSIAEPGIVIFDTLIAEVLQSAIAAIAPSVDISDFVTAATVIATATVEEATIASSLVLSVETLGLNSSLEVPNLSASSVASLVTQSASTTTETIAILIDASHSLSELGILAAPEAPSVLIDSVADLSAISAVAALNEPSISIAAGDAFVAAVVEAVSSVNGPTVSLSPTVAASYLSLVSAVEEISVLIDCQLNASTINAIAATEEPDVSVGSSQVVIVDSLELVASAFDSAVLISSVIDAAELVASIVAELHEYHIEQDVSVELTIIDLVSTLNSVAAGDPTPGLPSYITNAQREFVVKTNRTYTTKVRAI